MEKSVKLLIYPLSGRAKGEGDNCPFAPSPSAHHWRTYNEPYPGLYTAADAVYHLLRQQWSNFDPNRCKNFWTYAAPSKRFHHIFVISNIPMRKKLLFAAQNSTKKKFSEKEQLHQFTNYVRVIHYIFDFPYRDRAFPRSKVSLIWGTTKFGW